MTTFESRHAPSYSMSPCRVGLCALSRVCLVALSAESGPVVGPFH